MVYYKGLKRCDVSREGGIVVKYNNVSSTAGV